MKIRFQADADLRFPIVKGVKRREPLIEFQTANEAELEGVDDLIVLKIAADEGRLLVSHDVNTMPENFARFIETQASPGVVLIAQELPYHDAIERLIRLWATTEAETWHNVLFFLPR
ncbi:MAG: DUF5615 family PIN-like protein [Acidobacteriota bacterium]